MSIALADLPSFPRPSSEARVERAHAAVATARATTFDLTKPKYEMTKMPHVQARNSINPESTLFKYGLPARDPLFIVRP